MLDEISRKIIFELCQDGRSSNAKIAKKLGINVATVAKRVNAIIKEGVVSIKAIPNRIKMGYKAQVFIGLDVDLKKIDSVCAQLMDNPHVNLIVTSFGRLDILLNAYLRDFGMLQSFMEDLHRMEGITLIETYLVSGVDKRYQGMFTNELTESKPTLVDETNQRLINELIQNARPKYSDLSNKLGISISSVSKRIAFLLKEDIMRIVAIPNPSKIGYSANAYVFVRAELDKVDKICDQLASYPEVHQVMKLMNGFEILFGVHCPNSEMLYKFFRSRIMNIDGILNTETFIRGDFIYLSSNIMLPPSMLRPLG